MNYKPGMILKKKVQGGFRVWRVTGNYLGGVDEEDLVGLQSVDKLPGQASGIEHKGESLVPAELLVGCHLLNPEVQGSNERNYNIIGGCVEGLILRLETIRETNPELCLDDDIELAQKTLVKYRSEK